MLCTNAPAEWTQVLTPMPGSFDSPGSFNWHYWHGLSSRACP